MIGKNLRKVMSQLTLIFFYPKKEKICPAYVSKHNSNRGKQVILLMISNGGKRHWHYVAVKKLPVLLRGIFSKHHDDFYCLNCFHSFATENKHQSHKRVCENKNFCNIIMPLEETKIIEYQKSDKAPFIIYANLACMIKMTDGCKNDPKNLSIAISTISSFKSIENKHDIYTGKDCMKTFCEFFREHPIRIINFKKKKLKLLTKEQQGSYENAKMFYICEEKFWTQILKYKKHCNATDYCHYTGECRGAAHSILNLKYRPKKVV